MLSSWEQNCFLLDKTQFELGDNNKFGRVLSTESASVHFISLSLYVSILFTYMWSKAIIVPFQFHQTYMSGLIL